MDLNNFYIAFIENCEEQAMLEEAEALAQKVLKQSNDRKER